MHRREAPLPLYYQVELQLREAIESGRYRAGDRLPTESVLQQAFDVSRITIRTALKRLAEEGLITTKRGRGTFVTTQGIESQKIERNAARLDAFEEDLVRQGGSTRVKVLSAEREPASQRIATLLNIEEGTEVMRARRVGWVGEAPLWEESRYFHSSIGDALPRHALESASMTTMLEGIAGARIESSRLRITAAVATDEQAKHLHVSRGDPVLINEFVVSVNNRPIEAARAVFRADRYAFSVEVFAPNVPRDQVFHLSLSEEGTLSLVRQEVLA